MTNSSTRRSKFTRISPSHGEAEVAAIYAPSGDPGRAREWTGLGDKTRVDDGADSYLVRDGKIVAQTVHYA
jgi:hypothetical protein